MKRVQAPQARRPQFRSDIQNQIVDRQQRHTLEPLAGFEGVLGAAARAGPNRLHRQQRARHVSIPVDKLGEEGRLARLTEHGLDVS